jgi:hypothetical protein
VDRRRSSGPTEPDPDEREPIRSIWVFAVLLGLPVAGTPLWYPTGSIEPTVAGLPLWFAVAVLTTVAFSAFTSWVCLRRWNLAEPAEEAATGTADGEGDR